MRWWVSTNASRKTRGRGGTLAAVGFPGRLLRRTAGVPEIRNFRLKVSQSGSL
jgi:hypothetical protein